MSANATLSPTQPPSQTPPTQSTHDYLKLMRRTRWMSVLIIALVVVVIAMSVAGIVFYRQFNVVAKAQKDLAFTQFTDEWSNGQDFVQPTVNTIQFLHRGYSITFDKIEYNQNGLLLSGQVGNPTHLWISSLALNFTARPYPYKIRDKWEKEQSGPWQTWWSSEWDIGTAQTTVGALNPGSTAFFEVTIPNVKQTSDNIQIAVSFSGERYQYLGR
jgi:hypothetical protein